MYYGLVATQRGLMQRRRMTVCSWRIKAIGIFTRVKQLANDHVAAVLRG